MRDRQSLDLFVDDSQSTSAGERLEWPDSGRFPLNINTQKVGDTVVGDLRTSKNPLVVTGYAALDRLIDFIADCPESTNIRLLVGFEPFPSRRESYEVRGHSFPKEVEHYWLERGISLLLSAKLIRCKERLQRKTILARYLGNSKRRLHAKIYVGDEAATVGSSNFTHPGLSGQFEANARFSANRDPTRFRELRGIAENYWELGEDYSAELLSLLDRLLRLVTWQEALARACAELLEGDWATGFLQRDYLPGDADLWPAQRQGIAQALYVLSRQGSVLIADATGSGKTRMGANLIRAVLGQIVSSGRLRKGKALMICPPTVEDNWRWEAVLAGTPLDIFSHGSLSHSTSGRHDLNIESLRRAQLLCVDEGHNFLNIKSNRTQQLLRNMADHVMLFTATPINRSVVDLLRIADMLGADNLEPSTLDAFKKMLGVRKINRSLTEPEIEILRNEIQKFTVRRTKQMLNALIDQHPDAYRDKEGRTCRFPTHLPKIYRLDEPERDRALASKIRELADRLYAVSHFVRPIEMPEVLSQQGWSEESFLSSRLNSSKKIARYVVMASLRSSRVALAEHIAGTRKAAEDFELAEFQKHRHTGNMLNRLASIRGKVPENRLSIVLPTWLSDPGAHAAACDHDWKIYSDIYALIREMSSTREGNKAKHLIRLRESHSLVLAFDSRPISLAQIQREIALLAPQQETLIATGDPGSQRAMVISKFQPGSKAQEIIGLCSDSLSEGVNLQQASCMVHLDMPSVVRIAEQRAGRVDRLDSPHATIEAWWPDDAPEFALSSDERFIERYEAVESLLGSNMPLPEGLQSGSAVPINVLEFITEIEASEEKAQWDGIHDAFEPVRDLIDANKGLVDNETYRYYREVTARVISRVSVVRAATPWAFFCISGGAFRAPHWILFPSVEATPFTELSEVCSGLRDRLTSGVLDLSIDERAANLLASFVGRLSDAERGLLPRKKQRALSEMEIVLNNFAVAAGSRKDQESLDHYRAILEMLSTPRAEYQPDWDEVAARWLDLVRPVWYEKLKQPRNKPLLLKDIRRDLVNREETLGPGIIENFRSFPVLPSPDERISACILGVT